MTTTDLRTAVVTGASRGIGRAIAQALAVDHHVVCVGRTSDSIAETVDRITAADGQATGLVADIRSPDITDRLAAAAPDVHALVLNAGTYAPYAPVHALDPDDADAVFDTNVKAGLRLSRHVLASMRAQRAGRIVFVGSVTAFVGGHGQAIYAASKSALIGLVRSIAVEGGSRGVTCNLVDPGLIDTERIRSKLTGEVKERLLADTALRRIGEPEEVAAVVAFLVSDAASFVTGARIEVSGGVGLGAVPRRLAFRS